MSFGFAYFLQSCNSDNLKSLSFTHFIAKCGLRLVSELFPNLKSLELNHVKADWKSLSLFSSLKKLIIQDCVDWSEAGKEMYNISQLEVLEISHQYNDGMDRFFADPNDFKLIDLVDLTLLHTKVSDQQLSAISTTCEKLEVLTLGNQELTDLGISCISHLPSLQSLRLVQANRVTDRSLFYISKIPKLHHLALKCCLRLTPCCIKQIATIKNLTHLNLRLSLSETADEDFSSITNLTSLRTLEIYGMHRLTNASLAVISQLSNLRQLDVSSCNGFTDEGLSHLAKLVHLKALICDVYTDDHDDEDEVPYPITMVGINTHNLSHLLIESF